VPNCVVRVSFEINLGGFTLRDTIDWDLGQRQMTPELFMTALFHDLGLEDQTQITSLTHSIEEQLLHHIRSMPSLRTLDQLGLIKQHEK